MGNNKGRCSEAKRIREVVVRTRRYLQGWIEALEGMSGWSAISPSETPFSRIKDRAGRGSKETAKAEMRGRPGRACDLMHLQVIDIEFELLG